MYSPNFEHVSLHPLAASDTQLQTKLECAQNKCHQPNRAAQTISVPQNLLALAPDHVKMKATQHTFWQEALNSKYMVQCLALRAASSKNLQAD